MKIKKENLNVLEWIFYTFGAVCIATSLAIYLNVKIGVCINYLDCIRTYVFVGLLFMFVGFGGFAQEITSAQKIRLLHKNAEYRNITFIYI